MNTPNYIFEMPWFRELGIYGQLLFFDVLRAVHMQYSGMDVDLTEPRGLVVAHDRCSVNLSPGLFRKARKQLLFCGILFRVRVETRASREGEPVYRRDAYIFRLPS